MHENQPWHGRSYKPGWLAIDLETRSEIDLTKCGVYRYVEGEKHRILLFSYMFEGDADVSMVDMAMGETLPAEVLEAKGLCHRIIDPADTRKYLAGALESYANVF